jgi:hypothetical protein
VPSVPRTDDALVRLSDADVAAFYRRLANTIKAKHADSLAAAMLLHWLDGKGITFRFDARYVKDLDYVVEYLRDEVRPVFLTEKEATLKGGKKWGGVLPRIKGVPPHPMWDGRSNFTMLYEGPSVSIPMAVQAKAAAGLADPAELDLFMSLHTFGLHTDVVAAASAIPGATTYRITFEKWETRAFDRYDWDPKKYLTVPNPDFRNPFKVAIPVLPTSEKVKLYHSNAKRIEAAGLAAAYDAESTTWTVTDTKTVEPATIDSARSL